MTDVKKVVKPAPTDGDTVIKQPKSGDLLNVKNTSKRIIYAAKGAIQPGEFGKVTFAELSAYGKFLEKAKEV
jgi:hypothetical protein